MSSNKTNLEKLPKVLDIILKENPESQDWLIERILEKVEKYLPEGTGVSHPAIMRISEYCIEEIIQNQAEGFYKDFPIKEIKNQLIEDFKKMEHERRRNDFENFSLCCWQQIENIVNYLFANELLEILPHFQDEKMFQRKKDAEISLSQFLFQTKKKEYFDPKELGKKFSKEFLPNWYVSLKLKVVLYFYYFNKNVYSTYDFNNVFFSLNNIYLIRNKVHRGHMEEGFKKERGNEILSNKNIFFFNFLGLFGDFVMKIIENHASKGNSLDKVKGDNIGDIYPDLKLKFENVKKI